MRILNWRCLPCVVILVAAIGWGQTPNNTPPRPTVSVEAAADGFIARVDDETVRVTVCGDSVIHVVATPGGVTAKGASPQQPWMLDGACPRGTKFTFEQGPQGATLTTAKLKVQLSKRAGNLTYSAADGAEVGREGGSGPRTD